MNLKLSFVAVLVFAAVFISATISSSDNDPWEVPAKYEKMKNPQEANAESLKTGKQLWNKHCGSCHGKEGLGDGSKAAQLDTPCGDFTTDKFQAQSDGSLFYKTKFGRDEMPGYEKKIPYDEDLWHVVNYMRTMK
jgi:mono/diheme cytochrome c family protein